MKEGTTIRVDKEVYDEIRKMSSSFEDTPNSILRELFGLPKRKLAIPTKKKGKK